jgi:GDP-L-fucose synthase
MKILLTGGTGMVGSNVREAIAAGPGQSDDWRVVAPSWEELDLRDRQAVFAALAEGGYDAVVHAAGTVGGILANMKEPLRFFRDNIDMGLNVVFGAAQARIPKLVNLGSSCMYPREAENPLVEEQILKGELEPTNEGYALAKIATQRACTYVQREDETLAYRTIVPCNLYGRHDRFDPEHSHMIPAVILKTHQAKLEGRDSIDIWGDGTARREFMYAGDLGDFVVSALNDYDRLPDVMNVGPGTDWSIDEYYAAIAKAVGYEGSFAHDTTKPVGMKRKLVDTTRLREFGWSPPTSLEDGIATTYEFFLAHHAG